MKILRLKDRVKIKIGDVEFIVAPLSREQKRELGACRTMVNGEQQLDILEANSILLKYGLKGVKGVKDYSGNDYKLEFDGDNLSEDSISDILNMSVKDKLTASAWNVVNGMDDKLDLEGVSLEVIPCAVPDS